MFQKCKAMIFVDARNIIKGHLEAKANNTSLKEFGYKEVVDFFKKGGYEIIRSYYYDGAEHKSQRSSEKARFFNFLRKNGYTLRLKEIEHNKNPSQKGVDIYLASDMISLAFENAYDVAVLCSGDGDYHALIDLVKSKGKRVIVMSYKPCLSETLRECADEIMHIEKYQALQKGYSQQGGSP